jgi:outer membrane cobalamin receptor
MSPTPQNRLDDGRTIFSFTWTQQQSSPSRRQGRFWWLGDTLHNQSPGFVSDAEGSAFGAEWQSVLQLGSGAELTWGIEWQQARFVSASTFGGFQAEGSTAAGYVQYDVILGEKTFAGIGTRYDYHSVYGGQLNPRLGIVHFLTPDLRLRASLGRTFRGPTFGELFFPGGPTCPGSNPSLKPERAWSGDIGVEAAVTSALLVRFNGFYTDATDLISTGCNPQNVNSARVAGVSVEAVGRITDRWAVNANLTWSDGVDRTTGTPLLRLPPFQANIVLRYLAMQDTALSVVASYVSERPDLDFSTFPASRVTLPGYVTFGLRAEQRFGNLVLRAGVDNLFDTRFETLRGFPGPARTFFVQVGSEF